MVAHPLHSYLCPSILAAGFLDSWKGKLEIQDAIGISSVLEQVQFVYLCVSNGFIQINKNCFPAFFPRLLEHVRKDK